MSRVDDACAVSARLRSAGAHRGAATVAFHALIQLQAASAAARKAWSPHGPVALNPANDPAPSLMPDSIA